MYNDIDKILREEFALKKTAAEERARDNKILAEQNEIYRKLDKLGRETAFILGEERAKGSDQKVIDELTNSLSNIDELKTQALEKIGLNPLDLEPHYSCSLCNDTGLVNGYPCKCYKKRKNEEIIKLFSSNKDSFCTFNDIRTDIFKDEKQREEFLKLSALLEKWCNNYPDIKKFNIVISGWIGLGKTFLCKCMAERLMSRDFSVSFLSSFEMNNLMLKYHTTFDSHKEENLIPLLECDVLFIDDLGTEPILNNVTLSYFFNILSEREKRKKATIITTNLSEADIESRYDQRIFSRLCNKQVGSIFKLTGSDLRSVRLDEKH